MKKNFVEGELLKGYEVLKYAMDMHYPTWDNLGREESDIPNRINEDIDYILKNIDINSIEEPTFLIDDDKVSEYMEIDTSTIPPIVIECENGINYIVDGCHRYFTKKKLGETKILAYIPVN